MTTGTIDVNAVVSTESDLDDAIEAVRDALRSGAATNVSEAVDYVLSTLTLSVETTKRLVRIGFRTTVEQRLQNERKDIDLRGRFVVRGMSPTERSALLLILLEGADGRLKPLLEFSLVDVQYFRKTCISQVSAWHRREQAMMRAEKLLLEHKVERVNQLPNEALAMLNEAAEQAWQPNI